MAQRNCSLWRFAKKRGGRRDISAAAYIWLGLPAGRSGQAGASVAFQYIENILRKGKAAVMQGRRVVAAGDAAVSEKLLQRFQ